MVIRRENRKKFHDDDTSFCFVLNNGVFRDSKKHCPRPLSSSHSTFYLYINSYGTETTDSSKHFIMHLIKTKMTQVSLSFIMTTD